MAAMSGALAERIADIDQALREPPASGARVRQKEFHDYSGFFAATCGEERRVFVYFFLQKPGEKRNKSKGTDLIARAKRRQINKFPAARSDPQASITLAGGGFLVAERNVMSIAKLTKEAWQAQWSEVKRLKIQSSLP